MTTERVRWTKSKYGESVATMSGDVRLSVWECAGDELDDPPSWPSSAMADVGVFEVSIVDHDGADTKREAQRRAREAGLMAQKIVGVK